MFVEENGLMRIIKFDTYFKSDENIRGDTRIACFDDKLFIYNSELTHIYHIDIVNDEVKIISKLNISHLIKGKNFSLSHLVIDEEEVESRGLMLFSKSTTKTTKSIRIKSYYLEAYDWFYQGEIRMFSVEKNKVI